MSSKIRVRQKITWNMNVMTITFIVITIVIIPSVVSSLVVQGFSSHISRAGSYAIRLGGPKDERRDFRKHAWELHLHSFHIPKTLGFQRTSIGTSFSARISNNAHANTNTNRFIMKNNNQGHCRTRHYRQTLASSVTVQQFQSKQQEQEINNNNDNNDNNNYQHQACQQLMPIPIEDIVHKFDSYAKNIARNRPHNIITKQSMKDNTDTLLHQQHQQQRHACIVAIRSFVHTLENESHAWISILHNNNDNIDNNDNDVDDHRYHHYSITNEKATQLQLHINQAIIQAIRASADYGDYNMILKIIHTAIEFATSIRKASIHIVSSSYSPSSTSSEESITFTTTSLLSILQPRIFGEAITELKRTKASTSKINKLWKLFVNLGSVKIQNIQQQTLLNSQVINQQYEDVLSSTPSAFELNAMLLALSSHGKVKAALSLFYGHVLNQWSDKNMTVEGDINSNNIRLHIEGDEYTASTIMTILAESIASDIVVSNVSRQHQQQFSLESRKIERRKYTASPCWQWREAESILNSIENYHDHNTTSSMLNNYVYSVVLKVNEEATELYKYPGNRHFGSTTAMSILERMKRQNISPDVVTCSAVMAAFDKGMQWKAALSLLKSMEQSRNSQNHCENGNNGRKDAWRLPLPNEYSYASAISSCARSGQFDEAIKILDRIRERKENSDEVESRSNSMKEKVSPNIWMYNAALAACMPSKSLSKNQKDQNSRRSKTAMNILRRMEEDAKNGLNTLPDTVSYNTVIAAMGHSEININESSDDYSGLDSNVIYVEDDGPSSCAELEKCVVQLLDEMKQKAVKRDPITYRNAMRICRDDAEASVRFLHEAFNDLNNFDLGERSKWGSVENVKTYLINVALNVCAAKGNIDLVAKLFKFMRNQNLHADSCSMNQLIISLSNTGYCENSMWVLNAMKGDGAANAMFYEKFKIDVIDIGNFLEQPMIQDLHYSTAITHCLRQGELFSALKILNGMKVHGLKPNESSLYGIIIAYCKLATDASTLEFKEAAKEVRLSKLTLFRNPIPKVSYEVSRTRANAALAMLKSMTEAPIRLQSIVASACAAAGMWIEARELLWSIHIAAVKEKYHDQTINLAVQSQGSAIEELPRLHNSLLKLCARSGNVTAALWFSDAIQDLSTKFERRKRNHKIDEESPILVLSKLNADDNLSDSSIEVENMISQTSIDNLYKQDGIGMGKEEWKLVNIAASKSCHWKVCLGILQFLQPYLEATNPRHALLGKDYDESLSKLNKEYDSFSRALTDAILAFEARSQYAWAIRAIDDWIEWSGRRPRMEAVFAACRILANRGYGIQVVSLVTKVMNVPSQNNGSKDGSEVIGIPSYEASYERAVYTEAITSLFKHGLYDNADELYAAAASQGFLPWAKVDKKSSSRIQLDLHGMNKATAHSAVRVSLQQIFQSVASNGTIDHDVLIVTGKGKRSSQHLRPVLRPEVQRMLMEEFYPPLGTTSVPGNMGALSISRKDINSWLHHQQQQRGQRFLAMADVLKTFSSGERLRQLLKQKMENEAS